MAAPPPATILDIRGGPGRYAIALAQRGYSVTLLDLSERNLDFARQKATQAGLALKDTLHGNALGLGAFTNGSFDAVLLMGPLYHLLTPQDRRRAIDEAGRVLKPGGVIASACITRCAALKDAALREPLWPIEKTAEVASYLATGVLHIPPGSGFTDHYAAHPVEFAPLFEQAGFKRQALIGVEGIVAGLDAGLAALPSAAWEAWVELNYRLGHDPSTHGGAYHLLYIGHAPTSHKTE